MHALLTKPFAPLELLARLRVALRHAVYETSSGNVQFRRNSF